MKIAIVGPHSSGKTTAINGLTHKLRSENINVGATPQVARESPYMIAKERSANAQLHVFLSQAETEVRFQRDYCHLLTDRSIFDHMAYLRIGFPNHYYVEMENSFAREFAKTYDEVFVLSKLFDPKKANDTLRDTRGGFQEKMKLELGSILDEYYPNRIIVPKDVDSLKHIYKLLKPKMC